MRSMAVGYFSSGVFTTHLSWFIIIVMSLCILYKTYTICAAIIFQFDPILLPLCRYMYRKYIIIYEFDALAIGPIRNVGNNIRTLQYYYRNSRPQYKHVNMYIIKNDL